MGKVTDISKGVGGYTLLSQTPNNRSKNNFFLKELQDKYDAEWQYAPNVVTVEFEKTWGQEDYETIEVRDQRPRSDKNKAYADDLKRLVFRDIHEKRFRIGSKFRFNDYFDLEMPPEKRDIWLVTNMVYSSPATSVVVSRCSGRLGYRLKDDRGLSDTYYEPAIINSELKGVAFHYSETTVSPKSDLVAVVQHNERTAHFYINQRFVIGYDQVYRIKGLNKFYADATFDPFSAGLIMLHLELTEQSPKDVFGDVDIAYEEHHPVVMEPDKDDSVYKIEWVSPREFPQTLPMEETVFEAKVLKNGVPVSNEMRFGYSLENLPDGVDPARYVDFRWVEGENSFKICRRKPYLNGNIIITADVVPSRSDTDGGYGVSFRMLMSGI